VLRRQVGIESSRNIRTPPEPSVPTGVALRRRIVIVTSVVACTAAAILAVSLWLAPGQNSSAPASKSATVTVPSTSAPAVAPPKPVATEAPPAALGGADRSLQERLDRVTATYEQGNLTGALRLVDPVLATTDDDRVRRLARSIAQSAYRGMVSAENAAVGQKARELSSRSFAAANQLRTRADQAMARSDFVEAGTQALAATTGYEHAMVEARAAAVPTSRPSALEPVIPAAPSTVANNNPPVAPVPSVPATVPAVSPPTAPPTNNAAPVTAAVITPASAEDRERPGILQTLTRYQNAYRERSVKSLLAVYPSLPREARQGLERAFTRDCRDYDATFGNIQLALNKDDPTYATVTVRTTYTCQPKTAQPAQPQSVQELFVLRKLGDGWLIESAGTMDTTRRR
jgi:hypothetical protein